jgi:hypothetical protein
LKAGAAVPARPRTFGVRGIRDIVGFMDENPSKGVPQFATAEYSGAPAATPCKGCGQAIGGAYYQVNGVPACEKCARQIKEQTLHDPHPAFVRGILFGVAGAIVGLGIYVAFALATGLIIGYISLAVGYIVGKAIVMGSKGRGGRRYQLAAALLTYMAVSLAAVPIAVSQHMKQGRAQRQVQSGDSAAPAPKMSAGKAVATLTLLGLASPFLALSNPAHGIIGFIILLIGIQIAWKITAAKPLKIVGPLNEAAPATPG